MPSALAFRYARALADLAPATLAEAVSNELNAFVRAMHASGDLRTVIQSPAVPRQRKRSVVTRLTKMLPLSDVVRRFLLVVIDHRRAGLLADIREAFELVVDERQGVVRADIRSARELGEAERKELAGSLGRLTGKKIRAFFHVEPALIGGAVARIGSTVYDGSVSGQLEAIKVRLAGT